MLRQIVVAHTLGLVDARRFRVEFHGLVDGFLGAFAVGDHTQEVHRRNRLAAQGAEDAIVFGILRLQGNGSLGRARTGFSGLLGAGLVLEFKADFAQVGIGEGDSVMRHGIVGRLVGGGLERRDRFLQRGAILTVARLEEICVPGWRGCQYGRRDN